MTGSNCRHPPCKGGALPAELIARYENGFYAVAAWLLMRNAIRLFLRSAFLEWMRLVLAALSRREAYSLYRLLSASFSPSWMAFRIFFAWVLRRFRFWEFAAFLRLVLRISFSEDFMFAKDRPSFRGMLSRFSQLSSVSIRFFGF